MIPRQRDEASAAYLRRALIAHTEVSTHDLVAVRTPDGKPAPVSPQEAAQIVARLRTKQWHIATIKRDAAGWLWYRLIDRPPKKNGKEEEPDEYAAALARIEVTRWACEECGEHPAVPPKALLGGLGEGPCPTCKKRRVLFRLHDQRVDRLRGEG